MTKSKRIRWAGHVERYSVILVCKRGHLEGFAYMKGQSQNASSKDSIGGHELD
jgi:hypothetical protein